MVYTVRIAEQTVITVSENECIYISMIKDWTETLGHDNRTSVLASFHLPNFPHLGLGEPVAYGFHTLANGSAI